jgi:hypothetical protein
MIVQMISREYRYPAAAVRRFWLEPGHGAGVGRLALSYYRNRHWNGSDCCVLSLQLGTGVKLGALQFEPEPRRRDMELAADSVAVIPRAVELVKGRPERLLVEVVDLDKAFQ